MTMQEKLDWYRKGWWVCPAHPVCSAHWSSRDWIRFIDAAGRWISPAQREANERAIVEAFRGCQWVPDQDTLKSWLQYIDNLVQIGG